MDARLDLIRLSGLEPHRGIEISYTGIRPGEKLTEELWAERTPLVQTLHPDIFRLDADDSLPSFSLIQAIDSLSTLGHAANPHAIIKLLDELIPGSSIRETSHPDITSII